MCCARDRGWWAGEAGCVTGLRGTARTYRALWGSDPLMSTHTNLRVPLLLLLVSFAFLVLPGVAFAAQPPVDLGTTESFAILAGSTITNTGSTIISGDAGGNVGLYPGTAFPGQASVTLSGEVHLADAVAQVAKDDLVTAYNDAAGRTPVTTIPTELGGQTLTPGVYDSASGTFQITGTLTLDAQGDPDAVFVFQTASTLITASNSTVNLLNEARYCRIFWKVGSSATLGTGSHFVGHLFALTSIAAQTGATVQGQLLARNGAVTLDTNTITNGLCATVATSTTTTLDGTTSTTLDGGPTTTTPGGTSTTLDGGPTTTTPGGTSTTLGGATSTTLGGATSTTLGGGTTTTSLSGGTTTTGATTTTTAPSDTTTTTAPGRGQFPFTGLPLANVFLAGAALVLTGVAGRWVFSQKLPR